jgi:hypothetical protein
MNDGSTFFGLNASAGNIFLNIDTDGAYLGASESGVRVVIKTDSYSLAAQQSSHLHRVVATTPITVSLPGGLPVGFTVTVFQDNTGQVTFVPTTGATLVNRQNFTRTQGINAVVTLIVVSNPDGASAKYLLAGDGA